MPVADLLQHFVVYVILITGKLCAFVTFRTLTYMAGGEYFVSLCPRWKPDFVVCRDQSEIQN